MKFIYLCICLSFSLCLHSKSNDDLLFGINLFETGKYKEAVGILKPLAENENAMANYYLGLIHDPVYNKPPFSNRYINYDKENEKITKSYYRKAMELGSAYASFQLGEYYQSILRRRQNYRLGEKLGRKVRKKLEVQSKQGDWLAKYMLAKISGNSSRTRLKAKFAMEAMEKEAKKGDTQAQFYLGRSLSQWLCRTDECKNFPAAFAWFVVSTSQGSYHAKNHLINITKMMKKNEIEAGKIIADEYLSKYRSTKYNKSVNSDSAKDTPLELH